MSSVSIIIPTYNEAKNLPLLAEEIFEVIDKNDIDLELIIVDDNSPDGTWQVAEELSKKYPIKVIRRAEKLGLGSAVREGFKLSDRPILGVMDADLSHDPNNINQMVALLKENDVVLGSRFTAGSAVEKWIWWRKIISEVGVFITRFITGVNDPLSGFFFLRRDVIAGVPLTTTGYKILLEILIKGKYARAQEVPFQFRIRQFSTSKLNKKEYWLFIKQIIAYSGYKLLLWVRTNKYLVVILAFSALAFLYHISYRTFWGDEMAVLDYLKYSLGSFLAAYWQHPDNHPPLYYFLVLIASKILPWTELTIRLVSILSGLGIVCLVYYFAIRISSDKKVALLAAFFTAFSSYFVLISQMARYHSLAAFFSLLTLYFFYRLYFEPYQKSVWHWYLVALILTGYADYPHFFYVALISNVVFAYAIIRKRPIMPLFKWLRGQLFAAIILSPLLWIIYHRIVVQGDGGWDKANLLSNSWVSILMAILFHIYSFFFGENIFPWNYSFFIGAFVLMAILVGLVYGFKKKTWAARELFVILLGAVLIIINTLFMNVADPRYNFIVYPKFGFIAYPIIVLAFVICLFKLEKKAQILMFILWALVASVGLWNFYNAKNFLNPSYFRKFEQFEFVRDHAEAGQYFAINANAGPGFYDFYRPRYFGSTIPITFDSTSSLAFPKGGKVWFFSVGAEGNDGTVSTESLVPAGYKILLRHDSVPLDPVFKVWKQKALRRASYTYKYTVFLLERI